MELLSAGSHPCFRGLAPLCSGIRHSVRFCVLGGFCHSFRQAYQNIFHENAHLCAGSQQGITLFSLLKGSLPSAYPYLLGTTFSYSRVGQIRPCKACGNLGVHSACCTRPMKAWPTRTTVTMGGLAMSPLYTGISLMTFA